MITTQNFQLNSLLPHNCPQFHGSCRKCWFPPADRARDAPVFKALLSWLVLYASVVSSLPERGFRSSCHELSCTLQPCTDVEVGQMCLARYEDSVWYRAVITGVQGDMCEVRPHSVHIEFGKGVKWQTAGNNFSQRCTVKKC